MAWHLKEHLEEEEVTKRGASMLLTVAPTAAPKAPCRKCPMPGCEYETTEGLETTMEVLDGLHIHCLQLHNMRGWFVGNTRWVNSHSTISAECK